MGEVQAHLPTDTSTMQLLMTENTWVTLSRPAHASLLTGLVTGASLLLGLPSAHAQPTNTRHTSCVCCMAYSHSSAKILAVVIWRRFREGERSVVLHTLPPVVMPTPFQRSMLL